MVIINSYIFWYPTERYYCERIDNDSFDYIVNFRKLPKFFGTLTNMFLKFNE